MNERNIVKSITVYPEGKRSTDNYAEIEVSIKATEKTVEGVMAYDEAVSVDVTIRVDGSMITTDLKGLSMLEDLVARLAQSRQELGI